MCPLRKRYPSTNYSTKVSFKYPIYAEVCMNNLKEELIKRGWSQHPNFKDSLKLGKSMLSIGLEHSDYRATKYSITPFIRY